MDLLSTYSLNDFFLFSGQTLVRHFELYNLYFWPWQVAFSFIIIILIGALCLKFRGRDRIISGIMALLWGWCAYAFHETFYSQINIVASYYALYFYVIAVFFLFFGSLFKKITYDFGPGRPYFYISIIIYSFMALPLINIILGRSTSEVLFFGWGCDETALGSLALTMLIRKKVFSYTLFSLIFVWIIISFMTSYVLNLVEIYAYALGLGLVVIGFILKKTEST